MQRRADEPSVGPSREPINRRGGAGEDFIDSLATIRVMSDHSETPRPGPGPGRLKVVEYKNGWLPYFAGGRGKCAEPCGARNLLLLADGVLRVREAGMRLGAGRVTWEWAAPPGGTPEQRRSAHHRVVWPSGPSRVPASAPYRLYPPRRPRPPQDIRRVLLRHRWQLPRLRGHLLARMLPGLLVVRDGTGPNASLAVKSRQIAERYWDL